MKKWRLLDSKLAFDNKWFRVRQDVVRLPSGKTLDDYFVWLRGDVSLIVAVTPAKELVLVKQYKHGVGDIIIEHPAGFVDEHETPEEAAKRELLEETGYSAPEFKLIAKFSEAPAKEVGRTFVFLAKNARKLSAPSPDENEEIEVVTYSVQELLKMIERGEIIASPTIAATFIAANLL